MLKSGVLLGPRSHESRMVLNFDLGVYGGHEAFGVIQFLDLGNRWARQVYFGGLEVRCTWLIDQTQSTSHTNTGAFRV